MGGAIAGLGQVAVLDANIAAQIVNSASMANFDPTVSVQRSSVNMVHASRQRDSSPFEHQ